MSLFDGEGWMEESACTGMLQRRSDNGGQDPVDYWHPAFDDDPTLCYAIARRVCAGCPVRLECLHYALGVIQREGKVLGMFGGLTPNELRDMARRNERPNRKVAQHGTRARYVGRPLPPCRCDACRAANTEWEHRRRLGANRLPETA